jgi:nitrite reductase (NADH) small subunit
MLVVSFAASGDGNCAVVGGRPFVLARTQRGPFLLHASCPHRGGPLHLAEQDASGTTLVCPWHGSRYPFTRSREAAFPVVRSGNRVTAVFPGHPAGGYVREYRPLARWLGGHHASRS